MRCQSGVMLLGGVRAVAVVKLRTFAIVCAPMIVAACASPPSTDRNTHASGYLFVWSGDADSADSDFLSVIDVDPASATYGEVLTTLPVGLSGRAHHSEHVMPEGGRLFVNAFGAGATWVVNLRDPLAPFIEASFRNAGPYTHPHSFERTPTGTVLATFQYGAQGTSQPGALVELDSLGNMIRASEAADPTDPELRPYSRSSVTCGFLANHDRWSGKRHRTKDHGKEDPSRHDYLSSRPIQTTRWGRRSARAGSSATMQSARPSPRLW